MKQVLLAAAMAVLVFAPVWADDKPAGTGQVTSGRATEAKSLSEYTRKLQEFQRMVLAAKPDERKELAKDRPNSKPYLERADKLIDKDATDEAAFDAILFVIQTMPRVDSKYVELLTAHHATRPQIGQAVMRLMSLRAAGAEKLAVAVIEKNSDRKVKGLACYAIGNALNQQANTNPAKLPDAEKYLARVEKDFADVELSRGRDGKITTLGQRVKGTLFAIRNLTIGKTVPEVKSHDLYDKSTTLSSLRGKVVVLDFWATWCGPCRQMIPHSRELTEKMKGKPFTLVSISSDAEKTTLTKFLEKEKMPWTHWWEGNGENNLHSSWGVTGIPTMYVVDAKGVIRHKSVGFGAKSMEKLEKIIEDLVQEAAAK